jgi:hypothetical protein
MARPEHKVWLSKLGSLAFKLNSELDKGSFISLDDSFRAARDGRALGLIRERFGDTTTISFLHSEDEITISHYFDSLAGALCPEEIGVHKNGICWFLGCTIEMMQQQQWEIPVGRA